MDYAYRKGDQARSILRMDAWLAKHPKATPVCPVCDQEMHLYGDSSRKVSTRFDHLDGAGCPASANASRLYAGLRAAPRGSDADALLAKSYVLDHIEEVYEKARSICPELLWTEFLPLLGSATKERIWHLKDFDPLYASYVLLCGVEKFNGRPGTKRPHALFFSLEARTRSGGYWNHTGPAKRYIWRVVSGLVEPMEMTPDLPAPWYRSRAKAELGL